MIMIFRASKDAWNWIRKLRIWFSNLKKQIKIFKKNQKSNFFASRPVQLSYFIPSSYVINQYTLLQLMVSQTTSWQSKPERIEEKNTKNQFFGGQVPET